MWCNGSTRGVGLRTRTCGTLVSRGAQRSARCTPKRAADAPPLPQFLANRLQFLRTLHFPLCSLSFLLSCSSSFYIYTLFRFCSMGHVNTRCSSREPRSEYIGHRVLDERQQSVPAFPPLSALCTTRPCWAFVRTSIFPQSYLRTHFFLAPVRSLLQ
jgi:hypothetical protein